MQPGRAAAHNQELSESKCPYPNPMPRYLGGSRAASKLALPPQHRTHGFRDEPEVLNRHACRASLPGLIMSRRRVHDYSISRDGFGAGKLQGLLHPLGTRGDQQQQWIFETACGRAMIGPSEGSTGIDHDVLVAGVKNIGATIMGRNTFAPYRGPWDASAKSTQWQGRRGPAPPDHHHEFVLSP